ncbi:hypothetical protein [Rhizobium leguminosarum]|jgi:hypothetical protein|uniref:hypothetical protein n=1 Tax=Rhizobium TaxID=379 RepID=UPI000518EF5B|nr:hypothetical protein [Rhizobium leguminosarum]
MSADYYRAQIKSKEVIIDRGRGIDKAEAMQRLKGGKDVYTTKSKANTLANALSQGQGTWKDNAHVIGGYQHYHDVTHKLRSHIFYGDPHFPEAAGARKPDPEDKDSNNGGP